MSIKLSIVIPVYNSEKYIKDCLKSFCYEIKKNVEVIIVDDFSKDSSLKICQEFIKRFNFIKLIRIDKNQGVSYARNTGIKNSKGKYLCFLDSDDKLLSGSIKNILNNIDNNKKDLFVLRYITFNQRIKKKNSVNKNQIIRSIPNKPIFASIKNLNQFELYCWNFVVKKELLKKNNINFRNIKTAEDWIFVSEIFCYLKSFSVIEQPVYCHRVQIESLGRKMGYVRADSNVRIMFNVSNLINSRKSNFNNKSTDFLLRILSLAYQDLFFNIILCNKTEIKKITSLLIRYKKNLLKFEKFKFINFSFLKLQNKDLQTYLVNNNNKKKKLIRNFLNILTEKNVILFCIGQYGRIVFKYLLKSKVKIVAIIDNNDAYQNKKINHLRVKKINYLQKNKKSFFKSNLLIVNKNRSDFKKIKLQLFKIGFVKKKIYHFNLI